MSTKTMLYIGNDEFISFEQPNSHSREQVLIDPTTIDIPPGTAMAKSTSTNNFVPWDPNGANGAQTFAGWMCHRRPASTVTQRCPLLTNDADVNMNKVSFLGATPPTAAQITALLATMSGASFRIKGRY